MKRGQLSEPKGKNAGQRPQPQPWGNNLLGPWRSRAGLGVRSNLAQGPPTAPAARRNTVGALPSATQPVTPQAPRGVGQLQIPRGPAPPKAPSSPGAGSSTGISIQTPPKCFPKSDTTLQPQDDRHPTRPIVDLEHIKNFHAGGFQYSYEAPNPESFEKRVMRLEELVNKLMAKSEIDNKTTDHLVQMVAGLVEKLNAY